MHSRLLILYASQTGQAEAISQQIYELCMFQLDVLDDQLSIERYCLDKTEKRFNLEKEKSVVFVVSTTGEGEPPENALKFYRRIRKRTLPNDYLSNLSFALLGLGDSNYDRFANFGHDLEKRLKELGAKQFYNSGFGDDAVGLEVGVEPWIEGLFPAILTHFNAYALTNIPKVQVKSKTINMSVSQVNQHSLLESVPPLSQLEQLTLPLIPGKFKDLSVKIHQDETSSSVRENDSDEIFFFNQLPVMESSIFDAKIVHIKELTKRNVASPSSDDKIVLEATFEVDSQTFPKHEPGDSFGFICGNSDEEVNFLLSHIGLQDKSDCFCEIVSPNKFPTIPKMVKVKDLVKYYLEIRSVAKKSCLRHLADFCEDEDEKRRLLELSSKEGADDYSKFIRNQSLGVLDLLKVFKTCKPSLEALIVNLPCFAPRYYSAVNTSNNDGLIKVAFTVVEMKPIYGRIGGQLHGVFTGLMHTIYTNKFLNKQQDNLIANMSDLSLNQDESQSSVISTIKMFKRKNINFKLPPSPSTPMILIGPGTGVAPFIGFLEQRQAQKKQSSIPIGETWLFFGCRKSDNDFIYEKELKSFIDEKVLAKLCVCFSRETSKPSGEDEEVKEENTPKYVQDLLLSHSSHIYKLIHNKNAYIYVCGDVKMMSVNVCNAIIKIVEQNSKLNHEDAVKYVRDLQTQKTYLQDVWI